MSLREVQQTNYHKAQAVLGKLQDGHDHSETAMFYQLTTAQVERWHRAALALRDLKTTKGHPRLFPRSRRYQLLPPEPVEIIEKREIAAAHAACRKLYGEPTARAELLLAIRYTLTHCDSSHGGIKFDNPEVFKRYMAVASAIFPWSRWLLQVKIASIETLSAWRCKPLTVQSKLMKQQGRFRHGAGLLKLRHVNETSRRERGKAGYSSDCLRTLFHRLAIVLFTAEEIDEWGRL